MEPSDTEIDVVRKITNLLRIQGELLLNGSAYLSMSANSVISINASFERIRETDFESSFDATPANSTKIPFCSEIQMLYDFIQKLIKLKVVHKDTSLSGRVSLVPFRKLHHLELKGVPLHLVVGITKIRSHLQSLSCTKCLPALKDLFESCGGDKSDASLSWHDLQSVYLRNNRLTELDNSLRLVPMVTALDVSHNNLVTTSDNLQFLTELVAVNLSFNRLESVPKFALSSQTRLKVLLLKFNRLISIEGVQELTGLHELDLTGNLIASHQQLRPLLTLGKLRKLCLNQNPVSYHKQHRKLSAAALHENCIEDVILDGKPLTKSEIKYRDEKAPHIHLRPPQNLLVNGCDMEQSLEIYDSLCTSAATSQSEAEMQVKVVMERKRKGKVKKKARKADISDMSGTFDAHSLDSAKASFTEEEQKIKQNIERMRNEMGPDWLQGLHQHITQDVNNPDVKQDELLQEGANTGLGLGTQGESHARGNTSSLSVSQDLKQSEETITVQIREEIQTSTPSSSHNKLLHLSGRSTPHGGRATPREGRCTPGGRATPGGEQKVSRPTSSTSLIWQSSSDQQSVDYGAESEPFIVSTIEDPTEEYILTVSERYLLEKDINGDVMEELDLKCLLDVSSRQQTLPAFNNDVIYCAKLTFDYVNKNKRDRQYIMEDMETCQALCELLSPALRANLERNKLENKLQCLKCNNEFQTVPVKRHARNSSYGGMTRISSVGKKMNQVPQDVLTEKGEEENLLCPKCGSDLVIELDPQPLAASDSHYGTPVGSLTKQGFPLATSSTFTSPVRGYESRDTRQRKVMPWESPGHIKTTADTASVAGETSSFKSCATDLSHSYRSVKDAVIAASNNPALKSFENARFHDVRNFQDGGRRNQDGGSSQNSSNTSPRHQHGSKHEDSPTRKLRNTEEWIKQTSDVDTGHSTSAFIAKRKFSNSDIELWKEDDIQAPAQKSMSQSDLNPFTDDSESTSFLTNRSDVTIAGNSSSHIGSSGTDLVILRNTSRSTERTPQNHIVHRQSGDDLIVLKNTSAEKSSSGYVSGERSSYEIVRHSGSDVAVLQISRSNDTDFITARKEGKENGTSVSQNNNVTRKGPMQQVNSQSNLDTQYSGKCRMTEQISTARQHGVSNTTRRIEEFDDTLDQSPFGSDLESSFDVQGKIYQGHNVSEKNLSPIHENKLSKSNSQDKLSSSSNGIHLKQTEDFKSLTRRQSSDIEVLNDDLPPLLKKPESETTQIETNGKTQRDTGPVSAYGSLTESAVHNMVDYMRSSIYDKAADVSTQPSNEHAVQEAYNFEDFSQIDHRLKLHLMMNVFSDDNEEFQLVFRCGVVPYGRGEEYEGLLVASNSYLYIFKIVGVEKLDEIAKWLKLLHSQSLTQLRYVDIGLGYQSFRIESGSESSCFDFIVRDELQCKTFMAQFSALLQGTSFTAKSELQAISKNNPESMTSIQDDVIRLACDAAGSDEADNDTTLLKFVKCYQCSDKNGRRPVCVAVSRYYICLAEENYSYPLPRIAEGHKGHTRVKGQQFTFQQSIDITDMCRLEMSQSKPCEMKVVYTCQDNTDLVLPLIFVTERAKVGLIETLKSVYYDQLDVDLDVDVAF